MHRNLISPISDFPGHRPFVRVVVLHYNTGPLLLDCLKSLQNLQYPNYDVVLVDNASTDGMTQIVKEQHLVASVVDNLFNSGYCGGNNLGIKSAFPDAAKYILILNPDTVVRNLGFLSAMVDWMESHDNAGFVGPCVYFRDYETTQNTSCHFPFLTRKVLSFLKPILFKTKKASDDYKQPKKVDVLNGVCVLLRIRMLREIGMYDEKMFMYGEDWDLSFRAKTKNWDSWFVPVPSVVHKQKEEGYDYLSMTNFLLKRNAIYFLKKHGFVFQALNVAAGALLVSFIRIFWVGIRSHGGVKAYSRFFVTLLIALFMVFLGRNDSPHFGPPNVSWSPIRP